MNTITVAIPIPEDLLRDAEGTPEKSGENYAIELLRCELEDSLYYDDHDVEGVTYAGTSYPTPVELLASADAEGEPPSPCYNFQLSLASGVDQNAACASARDAYEERLRQRFDARDFTV